MTTSPSSGHAHVVGLGLIGSSVALALSANGWRVTGDDAVPAVTREACERGIIEDGGVDGATLVVIATPASTVARLAHDILATNVDPSLIVTDVAGVKASITADVADPRFVGGHPMAGSELKGFAGARADLFHGATWVLTPITTTTPDTYTTLHGIIRELGANVVAVNADDHDRLVALASHVPHLVAGALMNEAALVAEPDPVLLQLAAGGFRDMTRVAAGDPAIWPDILFENRDAVTATLRSLVDRLQVLTHALESGDRSTVATALATASVARRALPGRAVNPEHLTHLRVAISDQPGSLARITTLASDLVVNIFDIEISHDVGLSSGVLLLTVETESAERFIAALADAGFRVGLS